MKTFRRVIVPALSAALLLLAVRGLLFCHLRLPADSALPDLRPNAHVVVSLTWYGLRLPGEGLWGHHRWGYRVPALGDAVVYRLPRADGETGGNDGQKGAEPTRVALCRALPRDTVWIDPVRRLVLPARTSPDALPLVIPSRSGSVRVTPWNARLLAYLLRRFEGTAATVTPDGGLQIGGQTLRRVRLLHDYYWVETHPDVYDLIPHDALVGKVVYASGRDER